MITAKDVAEHSGVSPATVSRVINNATNVSPDIRAKVLASIEELGYFPNHAARSLARRRSGAVAVLLRNLHSPYFTELLRGIEDAASTSNKNVIFCNLTDDQEYRDRYLQYLTNGIADGILIYGSLFSDRPMIEHLHTTKFPFLLVENNFRDMPVNQVLVDNYEGACTAVQHLIDSGHRRIAHFMGDPNKKVNLDRFNGYTVTLQNNDIPIAAYSIVNIYSDVESAYQAAQQLMQQPLDTRPTALFCSDDKLASRAIQGILDAGFSVPEDMSIIGFDNRIYYEHGYQGPRITSIKQPLYEIGKDSIHYLSQIINDEIETPFTKTYGTSLVQLDTVTTLF